MRLQLDTATSDALKRHQQHMAAVIGRLLAGHARKQATPSARLDPTLGKIEVRCCYCYYHRSVLNILDSLLANQIPAKGVVTIVCRIEIRKMAEC